MRAYKGLFFLILFPLAGWAQQEVPGTGTPGEGMQTQEVTSWVVFGRVTDLKGSVLGGVTVRVGADVGKDSLRMLKTNLQGEFQTVFQANAQTTSRLSVRLTASKSGYAEANETVEYSTADRSRGIELVLRSLTENPDELPLATFVETLASPLRQAAGKNPAAAAARKEIERGSEDLMDRQAARKGLPLLSRSVDRARSCVECRLLLALAMFQTGGWAGAARQIDEASKLNDAAASKRPEAPLMAGVLDEWRGDARGAVDAFQKALAIDPNNVLALQELGRVLVAQKRWEAADQYLDKALHAGARDEARLLRVRALLGEGDIDEAGHEMDQYAAGHEVKTLPPEARTLYLQVQEHLNLERYAKVKSVLTESPQDLVKAMPELGGIPITSDQTELPGLLKRVGEGVEAYFKNFPNTVSLEHVHQERLGADGKVAKALDNEFQYLLLAHPSQWGMDITEQRATLQGGIGALGGLDEGFMLTGGFASVSLLFHPALQDGAGFRYLGSQSPQGKEVGKTHGAQEILSASDGRKLLLKPDGTRASVKEEQPSGKGLHVVAFAQKPEKARTTERFKTESGSAVILVQGLAWIDPTTFQIVRLRTDLLAPQPKVKLLKQTTEIQYKEVSFKEAAAALWLPQDVSVTVELRGRVYHNLHHYSDFKLFNVETKEERKSASLPAEPEQGK